VLLSLQVDEACAEPISVSISLRQRAGNAQQLGACDREAAE
jgi:hypothetical protein